MMARATLRLAALMALAVTLLSLGAMALQYRLVSARLMEAPSATVTFPATGSRSSIRARTSLTSVTTPP